MKQQLYVSTRNESVRMFESNFFEFFTHVHPITPVVLYLPVVIWMLYLSFQRGISTLAITVFFTVGLILWTLFEYVIHRWCFHYEPKTHWGRQLHFIVHGVHHDYPNDASRLVMPPTISIPLAIAFYALFALVFGRVAPTVWAGLVVGYICYDMIHYATHHFTLRGRIGAWLKQYHLRHHYKDDHAGYGVSSPLWDYVFRTTRRRSHEAASTDSLNTAV
jgi:sterol desaturase/sphingolipid hydroxylase (fatty acid hydroxylase superfamily)